MGSGLIFAIPFGLVGLVAALVLGMPAVGLILFGAAVLNRVIESWLVGWGVVRDRVALWQAWMYPLRDLLGFVVWVASYTGASFVWRDNKYELRGDKIVLRKKV